MQNRVAIFAAVLAVLAALVSAWLAANQARLPFAAATSERLRSLEDVVGVHQTPGVRSLLTRLQALESRPAESSGISLKQLETLSQKTQALSTQLQDLLNHTTALETQRAAVTEAMQELHTQLQNLHARTAALETERSTVTEKTQALHTQLQDLLNRTAALETQRAIIDATASKLTLLNERVEQMRSQRSSRALESDNHLTFEVRKCQYSSNDLSCLVAITYQHPIIGDISMHSTSPAYCDDDFYLIAHYKNISSSFIVEQADQYHQQTASTVSLGQQSSPIYVKKAIAAGDYLRATLHFPPPSSGIDKIDSLLLTYRHCFFKMVQFHDIPLSH